MQCLNIWQLRLSVFSEHCGIYFQAHFPLGWCMHVFVRVVSGMVYLIEELLAHTHTHTHSHCPPALSSALVSMSYVMSWWKQKQPIQRWVWGHRREEWDMVWWLWGSPSPCVCDDLHLLLTSDDTSFCWRCTANRNKSRETEQMVSILFHLLPLIILFLKQTCWGTHLTLPRREPGFSVVLYYPHRVKWGTSALWRELWQCYQLSKHKLITIYLGISL